MKNIHYVLGERCNLRCTYCDVNTSSSEKLLNEDFDKVYNEIEKHPSYTLDLFGGEPFLFLDEIEYILSVYEKNVSKCSVIKITTNGTVFNDRVKNIIKNPLVKITISFDGNLQYIQRPNASGTMYKLYISDFISNVDYDIRGHCMINGETLRKYNITSLHKDILKQNLIPNLVLVRDIGSFVKEDIPVFRKQFKEYIEYALDDLNEKSSSHSVAFSDIPLFIQNYTFSYLRYKVKQEYTSDCSVGVDYLSYIKNNTGDYKIGCERFLRNNDVKLENKDSVMHKCITCDISAFCHKGCIYEQILNKCVIEELCEIYHIIFDEIKKSFSKNKNIDFLKLFIRNYKS
jgi:sulfatase maturation enzyme AslB (radical SAM superfamily)